MAVKDSFFRVYQLNARHGSCTFGFLELTGEFVRKLPVITEGTV